MYTVSARVILVIAALQVAFPASAEIYKWVDGQGRVHYGDRPEGESSTQQIEVDEAPSAPPSSDSMSREEKRRRLLETMQEDRDEKAERRAQKKAERERDHRNCIQYRDRKRQLESASRLYSLDRDGNRVFISNEERDRTMRDLQARINKYCH